MNEKHRSLNYLSSKIISYYSLKNVIIVDIHEMCCLINLEKWKSTLMPVFPLPKVNEKLAESFM